MGQGDSQSRLPSTAHALFRWNAGANAAMIMFGWSLEIANEGRARPQWLHYVFGCIVGAVPWLVIFVTLLLSATQPGAAAIPGFVVAIFVSLFVFFDVFAVNMVLQYRKIGPWRDLDGANQDFGPAGHVDG